MDLEWNIELAPGANPDLPSSIELKYTFGDGFQSFEFNNQRKAGAID